MGGICLLASGIIFLLVAIFSVILGPAPSSGEAYLQGLSTHVLIARLNFGLYALSDILFVPVAIALYLVLKGLNKNLALLGAGFMGMYCVFDLAITELNSLALVSLTQQYANATSEVLKAAYVSAAQFALTTIPIATFFTYLTSSVGLILISVVMLHGVFNKLSGLLGLTAGIEGTIGAFYVFVPGIAGILLPALIAYGLWGCFSGMRLFRLSRRIGS